MTITRREFLQIGSAITLSSTIGSSAVNPVLGLIAPPADYPVPDEAITLYASHVQFKVFGLGLPAMTPEGYDSVIDKMTPAAVKLAKEGANAIVLFGTSMTFYKGAKFNEELIAQARKATGLPATSMSTAVIDGLRAAGGKRIAVATAYNDEVNRRFDECEVAYSAVFDMEDAFRDIQFRAREAMVRVPDPDIGEAVVSNVVPRFSRTPGAVEFLGPAMGAHNEEVYCGELGYSMERLARLREDGII